MQNMQKYAFKICEKYAIKYIKNMQRICTKICKICKIHGICNEYVLKHAKYAKYANKLLYAEYALPTLLMYHTWTMISHYDITGVKVYITLWYIIWYHNDLTMISHMISPLYDIIVLLWCHMSYYDIICDIIHDIVVYIEWCRSFITCDVICDVTVCYHNYVMS